jgi:hypothetical protein
MCNPPEYFRKPSPFISAYDVPIKRAERSGRLDLLVDLRSSRMVIHMRPDFMASGFHPDMMKSARLKLFTLSIDGINYHVNLEKATIRTTPIFTYCELMIPESWDPQTRSLPLRPTSRVSFARRDADLAEHGDAHHRVESYVLDPFTAPKARPDRTFGAPYVISLGKSRGILHKALGTSGLVPRAFGLARSRYGLLSLLVALSDILKCLLYNRLEPALIHLVQSI